MSAAATYLADVFERGYWSRLDGVDIKDNPYQAKGGAAINRQAHCAWADGWYAADGEEKK